MLGVPHRVIEDNGQEVERQKSTGDPGFPPPQLVTPASLISLI